MDGKLRSRACLAIAALAGFTLAVSDAATASPPPQAVRVGAAPTLPSGARATAALPATKPLRLTVALKSQDPGELASFAGEVAARSSPRFREYLTVAQFAQRFGATPAQVATVRSALQAQGLTVGAPDANELTLPVRGTASQVEQALSVSLSQVKLADGRSAYANAQAPSIAADAARYVQGIVGLDNLAPDEPQQVGDRARASGPRQALRKPASNAAKGSQIVTGGPQPCLRARQEEEAYTADKIASAYRFSSLYLGGDLGAGQTIALFEQQPFNPADISTYQTCYGTSATVSSVDVDGGPEGPVSEDGESSLDIEQVIGLAPQAHVLVYQGPEEQEVAPIDIIAAIVSEDRAKVISSSWGVCESIAAELGPTVIASENTLLQEAAAQGQSFFVSSGDSGSEQCAQVESSDHELAVLNPASQPFATGVGGTALYSVNGNNLDFYDGTLPPSEGIWNYGFHNEGGAGGGGISEEFAMPSYQSGASPSLGVVNADSSSLPCGKAPFCREVPDVSADADPGTGYVVFDEGQWQVIGGTSASAPLWAAFTSLVNASPACGGVPVGFANPALYSIASSNYTSNFTDVIEPSLASPRRANNNPEDAGLFPVTAGYDMATGIGTPLGTQLAASLCALANTPPEEGAEGGGPPSIPSAPGGTTTTTSAASTSPANTALVGSAPGGLAAIASTQIAAQILRQLTPSGSTAKIATLLKSGAFSVKYQALEAGTATIEWVELPTGAKLAKHAKPKPVLIASGRMSFSAAGTATIKLRLSPTGKALLKHAKQLKLTAKGTFTPTGNTPVSATKSFVLKR
jgi:subtilase family serine protease